MAPLILHNVPEDECYIGDDGIRRPYAMIFNQQDGTHTGTTRSRRSIAESGSFGKSTRRSRSKTGTPARGGARENPTLAAADRLFGDWVSGQASAAAAAAAASSPQRKGSGGQQPAQVQLQQPVPDDDGSSAAPVAPGPQRAIKSHPVEMILRGYRSVVQQYTAIAHYEALAGAILEDYARDPPVTQRRYKSELRDPAFTRRRALSPEERAMVNRAAGGEHWVKVTFESAEAAAAAAFASPQRVLGYLVYAEPYRGIPPARDEACPDVDALDAGNHHQQYRRHHHYQQQPQQQQQQQHQKQQQQQQQHYHDDERSHSTPTAPGISRCKSAAGAGMPTVFKSRLLDMSPPNSRTSSQTMDSATVSPSHASSATVTDNQRQGPYPPLGPSSRAEPAETGDRDGVFCRRIPTARRANLLPAEQALLPQQSVVQRLASAAPLLRWFSGTMIGNEVPRSDVGDFDWGRASLYWKVIWWLDSTFGLFGGDICGDDKDE